MRTSERLVVFLVLLHIVFLSLSVGKSAGPPVRPVRTDLNGDPLPPGASARIGSVRFYHSHMLLAVAFSGDGKKITSTSYDGQRTWDSSSGRQLGEVKKIAKVP